MKYINSKEASLLWKVSERMVRDYCNNGRVPGAYLKGHVWMIPVNSSKPERKRNPKERTLLQILTDEKNFKIKGGIYHKLQIDMTYNSNHIEGSKLNHDQTRYIYETKTLIGDNQAINIDDIIETVNHFDCIDLSISEASKKLSVSFIKSLHRLLKTGTSDSKLSWFNVGDYKLLDNEVGGMPTTPPSEVKKAMDDLLDSYNKHSSHTLIEIIDFHYHFEKIHPFQDGNGRVGRLIMLKECLKNNIVPVLIKDEFKAFYYRGLSEWKNDRGYLLDTCLHGQDIFKSYLDYFHIKY